MSLSVLLLPYIHSWHRMWQFMQVSFSLRQTNSHAHQPLYVILRLFRLTQEFYSF
jgi:hypothetical protein